MEDLGYILFSFIGFIISLVIARWIFDIPTIIRNQKNQEYQLTVLRRVISRMAMQQGVAEYEIKEIMKEAEKAR